MTDLLRSTGFLFTRTEIASAVLAAEYGEGYRGPGAVIGAGLRSWTIKIDTLPDDAAAGLVQGQSRATYLWDFFRNAKAANDAAFFIYDYKDDLFYLASFTDDELSFEMFCAKVFSTGLQFRERRIVGVDSPVDGLPILDELGAAILDETNQSILEEGII